MSSTSIGLWLLLFCRATDAISYYYSYEDATCVDDGTIEGTFVLSWDDADYSAFGYSASYYGGCLYLVDGSMDIGNETALDSSTDGYEYGYCVACDGVTGCSSDGTCDNFMTLPAPDSYYSGYQLSESQSQSSSSIQQADTSRYGSAAQQVQASTVALTTTSSRTTTTPSAVFFASVGAVGLMLGGLAAVYWSGRHRVGNKALTKAMLEAQRPTNREHGVIV